MIQVTELRKRYRKVEALKGITLGVPSGGVTGILGPNGCGKTTLVKSILGLVVPDSGEITVHGVQINAGGSHREQIGYVPQNPEFPANLTVSELFSMVQDLRGRGAPLLARLIEEFGLASALSRTFGVLSGGTKQKVATVVAFMFDAPVLILDEPSVGLDPVSRAKLKDLLVDSAVAGKTVLIVSHLLGEVEPLLSQVAFLLDGELRFAGSIDEIQSHTPSGRLEDAVLRLTCAGSFGC